MIFKTWKCSYLRAKSRLDLRRWFSCWLWRNIAIWGTYVTKPVLNFAWTLWTLIGNWRCEELIGRPFLLNISHSSAFSPHLIHHSGDTLPSCMFALFVNPLNNTCCPIIAVILSSKKFDFHFWSIMAIPWLNTPLGWHYIRGNLKAGAINVLLILNL